jgi:hypothetical protein
VTTQKPPTDSDAPFYVPKRAQPSERPNPGRPCDICGVPRTLLTYTENARLVCKTCRPNLTHLSSH